MRCSSTWVICTFNATLYTPSTGRSSTLKTGTRRGRKPPCARGSGPPRSTAGWRGGVATRARAHPPPRRASGPTTPRRSTPAPRPRVRRGPGRRTAGDPWRTAARRSHTRRAVRQSAARRSPRTDVSPPTYTSSWNGTVPLTAAPPARSARVGRDRRVARREVGRRLRRHAPERLDRIPQRGMPLPGKARVQAAGRGDREVARVELERGARADLTEVTGPVVRPARPEDRAGVGAGVCVSEERAQGEPESRHERNRHPGAEPQLGRAHAVHAVRLRSIGLVARSIEPNELEAGGAQLHVKNRGKERSPELTRRVHAVRGRAGCVSDLAEEARAGGQGVEPVAGVTDPHPDEESDVGSIARAPERHRLRSPGVRATLRGHFARHRGDAGEQRESMGHPGHEPDIPPRRRASKAWARRFKATEGVPDGRGIPARFDGAGRTARGAAARAPYG